MTPEELVAIEQIKQLKGRYCRCMDTKDWQGFRQVFADHAILNVDRDVSTFGADPNPQPEVKGGDNIVQFVSELLKAAVTVHQCHTPEIRLIAPEAAKGIWAMEDVVQMPGFHLHGFGHYREEYILEKGEWHIASVHLTRLKIEMFEGDRKGPADLTFPE